MSGVKQKIVWVSIILLWVGSANPLWGRRFNSSLENEELLGTLSPEIPENLYVESTVSTFGIETQLKTYVQGESFRIETDLWGESSVVIMLPEDGIIYSYGEGRLQGTKLINCTEANSKEYLDLFMMGSFVLEDLLSAARNGEILDLVAQVEELEGEEVVYIEATVPSEMAGDEIRVVMWYSDRYGIPLQYELWTALFPLVMYKVESIQDSPQLTGDLFDPPNNIRFEEIDASLLTEDHWEDEGEVWDW